MGTGRGPPGLSAIALATAEERTLPALPRPDAPPVLIRADRAIRGETSVDISPSQNGHTRGMMSIAVMKQTRFRGMPMRRKSPKR